MFFCEGGGVGVNDLIDEFLVARLGLFYLFFFYFMKQNHKLETDPRHFHPPHVWLSAWESHSYARGG